MIENQGQQAVRREILEENELVAFFDSPQSERTKLFLSQIM